MLTPTTATATQPTPTPEVAIVIDDAERRCHAALRDIARLTRTGEVSPIEARDLETETVARFIARTRELETVGETSAEPLAGADGAAGIDSRQATEPTDWSRSPRPRGGSARGRALCERQMCVVATARVSSSVLRGLWQDEDEETLATRGELAAAGLL